MRAVNSKKFLMVSFIISIYTSPNVFSLTLNDYLKEVTEHNDEYQSAQLLAEAGFGRSEEGFLMLSPNLTSSVSYLKDDQPPLSEIIPHAKRVNKDIRVGVAKKFSTGTNVKLDYDSLYTDNSNLSARFTTHNKYWSVKPTVTLQQPLMRDWLGAETRALINLKNAQAKAQGHLNNFNQKKILADAESVYWDLATVVSNIAIREDSVKRSNKLADWAQKRSKSGLGNDSDLFQARSSLDQRKFELESLRDYQKSTARLFNAFRTLSSDSVPDRLDSYNKINIGALKPKSTDLPPGIREDLKAQYENYLATLAASQVSAQSTKPDLNLNMQYYPSSREESYRQSLNDSLNHKHNTYNIGLNLSVPLDRDLIANLNNSYKAQSRAALLEFNRKQFELSNEWKRLAEQFNLFIKQLHIADAIVKTQLEKLKNEEDLLKNGRTTTFQVLQFEQDYFNAQTQYLDTKNKLLKLSTMMKLFNN